MRIIPPFRPITLLSLVCACLFTSLLSAQPIISISGSGPSGGWVVIYNGQAYASSWTQTGRYTNVTITARLSSFGVPAQTGRAYLTTGLGPGTTVSSQIASTSFTFPLTLSDVTLFSGLTLEPGTYYLSMVGNSDSGSGWWTGCGAVIDAADGVSLGSDYGFFGLVDYLPASGIWAASPILMRFTVVAVTNSPVAPVSVGSTHLNLRAYKLLEENFITWDAAANAASYQIYRAENDHQWKLVATHLAVPRFRDSDFLWYPIYYKVVTVSASGELAASEEVAVDLAAHPLVRLSSNSLRPVSDTAMSIQWSVNAPSYNEWGLPAPGGAKAFLEVGSTPSNLALISVNNDYADSQRLLVSDLEPNTRYWYRLTIVGTNDAGFTYLNNFLTQPAIELASLTVSVPYNSPRLSTDEDTPIRFTMISDEPHDPPFTFTITRQPYFGTITGTSPNFIYTPRTDSAGMDTFEYTISDGQSTTTGEVSTWVNPINDPPVALDPEMGLWVQEDSSAILPLQATDFDFDAIFTFRIVSGPTNGTLRTESWGAISYIPNPNFNGIDHITFTASDGQAEGNLASVRIHVEPVNDAPTASDQTVIVAANTPKLISLSAHDLDGDLLTLYVRTLPAHGTLSVRGIGPLMENNCIRLTDLLYTPAPNFNGTDTFDYAVDDGYYSFASARVTITVGTPNRAPVAAAQSISTAVGTPVAITLSGSDVDGDSLTYQIASGPANGTLTGVSPNLTYKPQTNFAGSESFTFTASDGRLTSPAAVVTITVFRPNHAPQVVDQSAITEFGASVAITLSASDPDGDRLTYAVGAPAHGTLSGVAPTVTYAPALNFSGSDTFTFTASDGRLTSSALVTVTVNSSTAPPLGPTDLGLSADSDHQINLGWTDRSSSEKGFRIERSADAVTFKQIATVGANVRTYIDTGVQLTKIYYYRVRAYNKQGDSAWSNTASTAAVP